MSEAKRPDWDFDSGDDRRVDDNLMRHRYRVLQPDEKLRMKEVKDLGLQMWLVMDGLGTSRELSLAKTRVEEAVMWAVKHITKERS